MSLCAGACACMRVHVMTIEYVRVCVCIMRTCVRVLVYTYVINASWTNLFPAAITWNE